MTLEELKKEAKLHGYCLTKKLKYEKIEPCVCGNKRIIQEISLKPNEFGKYYYCSKCRLKCEVSKTNYQARINWNKIVKKNK